MMNQTDLQIKITQGFVKLRDGIDWFNAYNAKSKKEILQSLSYSLTQAHPTRKEVDDGIKLSELNPSYTPCVLLAKKAF